MSETLDILTLSFRQAWDLFILISNRDETYRKARFGINLKFDIYDYFNNRMVMKYKTGIALIMGKPFKIEDIETEREQREKLVKEWLLENYVEDDFYSPRGGK